MGWEELAGPLEIDGTTARLTRGESASGRLVVAVPDLTLVRLELLAEPLAEGDD